ncbi:substrate-binding domain-containing protein [bacterium]|nr:substrate-binding domain-containing protein [bacterium]
MRSTLHICIAISLLLCACSGEKHATQDLEGTCTISGAWALYPMVVAWAEAFQTLHPQVRFDISAGGAGKGMADCLAGVADLGMVSREIYSAEIEKGAWPVAVTKDAVVPTVSAANPFLESLLARGVTRGECIAVWISGDISDWSRLVPAGAAAPMHVYTRSDACGAAQTWALYLGGSQEDLRDIGVYGDPGVAEAVRSDALGIGFNNINYAYGMDDRLPVQGLKVLPLDLNENGSIDPEEDMYTTRDLLVNAIAAGRYPSPPARDLYLVSLGRPKNRIADAFLQWILNDGQQLIPGYGYIALAPELLQDEREKFRQPAE